MRLLYALIIFSSFKLLFGRLLKKIQKIFAFNSYLHYSNVDDNKKTRASLVLNSVQDKIW